MQDKRNYIYLYDLPKSEVTSTQIAESFKAHNIQLVGEGKAGKKPQINRDLFKPFYTAIVHIDAAEEFAKAKEMRYFKIGDYQVRVLPFDKDLKGESKNKIQNQNIFYKLPKDADKTVLTYEYLYQKFQEYGPIKSAKISLNPDHTPRGFAFVCFDNEDATNKCIAALGASGEVTKFEIKESKDIAKKLSNNLYFKNVPAEMEDDKVKLIFAPYGTIKSLVTQTNDIGKFGFVCYEDSTGKDKEQGAASVQKAIEELQNKELEGGNKLYVKQFLNKQQREQEKFQETIRYKTSKKRCNLYVKNFPASWSDKELTDTFSKYGEIERVKLEKKDGQNNTFAFVCFKKPDACSMAKQQLHGQVFDGKGLVINHYEIKEIRDLQLEEIRDKRDWEKYVASQAGGLQWNQLTNQPNLTHIIQQLLSLMHTQQPQAPMGGPRQGGDRRQGGGYRKPYNQRGGMQGQGQNMNQGMNPNMMRGGQQPMPQQQVMPQQPMMNNQAPMPPQQQQQQQQQQAMTIQQKYLQAAMQIINSVQERNPYMKEQVGHLIYDYVQSIVGQEMAPKITGMLIELPVPQIKQYLQSFEALQQRVGEASNLLKQQLQGAAEQQQQ